MVATAYSNTVIGQRPLLRRNAHAPRPDRSSDTIVYSDGRHKALLVALFKLSDFVSEA
jgi:hypothetical protein